MMSLKCTQCGKEIERASVENANMAISIGALEPFGKYEIHGQLTCECGRTYGFEATLTRVFQAPDAPV